MRLCCIWAKCGVGQFIDGHRVAAQPYLIAKETTLYFFLISTKVYVKRKPVKITAKLIWVGRIFST